MTQRVKGQEAVLTFVSDAGTEEALGNVLSAEFEFQFDILTTRFLGETSDRKDDIFRGVRGRVEVHLSTQDALRFVDRVKGRATRRTAASGRFQMLTSLAFPNGERPRALFPDIYWGNMPFNIPAGDEYVTLTLEFEGSDGRFLYS
jgi:hypothetical protein